MKTPVELLVEDDDYLAALLVDYEAARSDDRSWSQLMGTLFGILIALVGALVAALPSLNVNGCTGNRGSCDLWSGLLPATIPVAPVAVAAFAIYVGIPGVIRSYYMRGLEQEIRRVLASGE